MANLRGCEHTIAESAELALMWIATRDGCVSLMPDGQVLLGRALTPCQRWSRLAAADVRAALARRQWPTEITLRGNDPRTYALNLAKTGNGGVRVEARRV